MNITLNGETIAVVAGTPDARGALVRLTATSIARLVRPGEYGVVELGALRVRGHVAFVSARGQACRGFQLVIRDGAAKRVVDVALAWDRNGGKRPAALYADGCEPVPQADRALVEARGASLVDARLTPP